MGRGRHQDRRTLQPLASTPQHLFLMQTGNLARGSHPPTSACKKLVSGKAYRATAVVRSGVEKREGIDECKHRDTDTDVI